MINPYVAKYRLYPSPVLPKVPQWQNKGKGALHGEQARQDVLEPVAQAPTGTAWSDAARAGAENRDHAVDG